MLINSQTKFSCSSSVVTSRVDAARGVHKHLLCLMTLSSLCWPVRPVCLLLVRRGTGQPVRGPAGRAGRAAGRHSGPAPSPESSAPLTRTCPGRGAPLTFFPWDDRSPPEAWASPAGVGGWGGGRATSQTTTASSDSDRSQVFDRQIGNENPQISPNKRRKH